MAIKKKLAKKSKTTVVKKNKATKKQAQKGRIPKQSAKKNAVKKKTARKETHTRRKVLGTKAVGGKKKVEVSRPSQKKGPGRAGSQFSRDLPETRSAGQSGDLQGLSDIEQADSESVDELLEEGNAFEAGVVKGVENATDREESEVHTREVPEDDVPGEYLDED